MHLNGVSILETGGALFTALRKPEKCPKLPLGQITKGIAMDLVQNAEVDRELENHAIDRPGQSETNEMSPPVVIDEIRNKDRRFLVIRDDLLPGGSKQRACSALLEDYITQGTDHFCYASPFAGFAQVALAYTCQQMNLSCHLFCEMDPTQKFSGAMHEFTLLARSFGAEITMIKTLAEADILAAKAAKETARSIKIPLGFNCLAFRTAFEREIRIEWARIKRFLGKTPKRLWLPVGSGTLASVFNRVLDSETQLQCVNVRVLPASDDRIQLLHQNQRVRMYTTPESFQQKAACTPSIPSNIHYDAKIWQFLERFGQDEDVWWNVAR